ncbi:hypothetical protein niasHT_011508 [Heterodera trifolii]|uniref:Dynein heavy chain C-terminal domain-containing protein n=1 Tax=Heterodera trifolii TaxID=157864 RepID=A0ABD2LFA5_9BILA
MIWNVTYKPLLGWFNFLDSANLGSMLLPQHLRRTEENVRDPLFRFFEREINLGTGLLSDIRRDLNELLSTYCGDQKQNNHSRQLIDALVKRKRVSQLAPIFRAKQPNST